VRRAMSVKGRSHDVDAAFWFRETEEVVGRCGPCAPSSRAGRMR
jgi:hypothetical protein